MIPPHLPESRSIALATQRFGPTKEDLRKIRGYRTKLFADTLPSDHHRLVSVPLHGSRSKEQDLEFQSTVLGHEGINKVEAFSMLRGLMTGIWEGFYMVRPDTSDAQYISLTVYKLFCGGSSCQGLFYQAPVLSVTRDSSTPLRTSFAENHCKPSSPNTSASLTAILKFRLQRGTRLG